MLHVRAHGPTRVPAHRFLHQDPMLQLLRHHREDPAGHGSYPAGVMVLPEIPGAPRVSLALRRSPSLHVVSVRSFEFIRHRTPPECPPDHFVPWTASSALEAHWRHKEHPLGSPDPGMLQSAGLSPRARPNSFPQSAPLPRRVLASFACLSCFLFLGPSSFRWVVTLGPTSCDLYGPRHMQKGNTAVSFPTSPFASFPLSFHPFRL